jgi:hypothetical protein
MSFTVIPPKPGGEVDKRLRFVLVADGKEYELEVFHLAISSKASSRVCDNVVNLTGHCSEEAAKILERVINKPVWDPKVNDGAPTYFVWQCRICQEYSKWQEHISHKGEPHEPNLELVRTADL